jgi:hypothetical protein
MLALFAGIDSTGWSWEYKLLAAIGLFVLFVLAMNGGKFPKDTGSK